GSVGIVLHGVISLAVAAAGWVGSVHPEITPPSNFHHLRDTTGDGAQDHTQYRLCAPWHPLKPHRRHA
ncbi:hypothetical protein, partial [Pseudophaeobacter sp.]|uniref:hypothetical protein n=1 Tax=Pseudophaeobacter sp. TaxID=1971739 RepID=UPI0032D9904D